MSGVIVQQSQCPGCAAVGKDTARDNLILYDDGNTYCHACGYAEVDNEDGMEDVVEKKVTPLLHGNVKALYPRHISEDTCRFWNYQIGKIGDEMVHIANYCNSLGQPVAQKIRNSKKEFSKRGADINGLYGQWLHEAKDHISLVITEGEIDAMSITEVFGTRQAVVSLPFGAGSAEKYISKSMDWVSKFKDVVLCFDNDSAGKEAIDKCLSILPIGKVRLVNLTGKDANEMLQNGRKDELKQAIWNAKTVSPSTIIGLDDEDFIERCLKEPQFGEDFPWPAMTDITYGLREKELYVIAAPTAVGKTEFVRELISHMIGKKVKCGIFSFEQDASSTVRRIIGGYVNKKLHLPGETISEAELKKHIADIKDYVQLYDNRGSLTIEEVCGNVRYMAKSFNCKFFVIDNLKSLLAMKTKGMSDNDYLAKCTGLMIQLIHELNINIIVLTHVAKDKLNLSTYVTTSPKDPDKYNSMDSKEVGDLVNRPGLSWDSGRMPTTENIYGPAVLTDLADFVFALARNRISEDEDVQRVTRVRCLKARLDGAKAGKEFRLYYNSSGRLIEVKDVNNSNDRGKDICQEMI